MSITTSRLLSIDSGTYFHNTWHKEEKENILANLGIKVEYGEMLEEAQSRGTYLTASDKEHSEIIRIYVEEGLGNAAIAQRLHRSSRTPHEHIEAHNKAVERSGFCAPCKRAKGEYLSTSAIRGNMKRDQNCRTDSERRNGNLA